MLRGAEVALGEVEAVLEDLPGVEQAVALVQEDPTGVQRLIAYVTPSSLSSAEPHVRAAREASGPHDALLHHPSGRGDRIRPQAAMFPRLMRWAIRVLPRDHDQG